MFLSMNLPVLKPTGQPLLFGSWYGISTLLMSVSEKPMREETSRKLASWK